MSLTKKYILCPFWFWSEVCLSNMGIKAKSNRTVKTVEGTQNILEIFKYKYITARSQTTDNT